MFTIRHNLPEQIRQLRQAADEWERTKPQLVEALGVRVLSLAQTAYVEKARGGTGSDGITWKPLSRKTLEIRVRRRPPARRIVQQRKRLAQQIQKLKDQAKKKSMAASGKRKKKSVTAQVRDKYRPRQIANLRAQRKELSAKLQTLIDAEMSKHEIGVDTGLQRASAGPGFKAGDGKGGNVMTVDAAQSVVTVGYGRSYSAAFDKQRPLLPAELPQKWREDCDAMVMNWGERIVERLK